MLRGIELLSTRAADPWWKGAVDGFNRADMRELPDAYKDGYVLEAPVVEVPIYLAYLMNLIEGLGGRFEGRSLCPGRGVR